MPLAASCFRNAIRFHAAPRDVRRTGTQELGAAEHQGKRKLVAIMQQTLMVMHGKSDE